MISNSVFFAALALLAGLMYLLTDLVFLTPYRALIFQKYLAPVGVFSLFLIVNLTAAAYAFQRKLGLKDTGRKLQHVEKQLRPGEDLSGDLLRRLNG